MSKYEGRTPGEWWAETIMGTCVRFIIRSGDFVIAHVYGKPITGVTEASVKEREANARLIADAPMLANRVEALEAANETYVLANKELIGEVEMLTELATMQSQELDKLEAENEKMLAILKHCAGRAHANNEPENYKVIVELIAEVEGK